jgi:MSHA pilin protein MshC
LRYAQKEAIAQRRNVCVTLTTTQVSMQIGSPTYTSACNTPLLFPTGASSITAPAGITLSPAVTINFAPLGSTNSAQIITVSGATNNIVVEAVTGYVHSP